MFIKNYGLFWRLDEVNWRPGRGARGEFSLLGRRGVNRPNVRLADFRQQQGIYILYGNWGPYYVGLTRTQGLGKRLRDHLTDDHGDSWDRFSWFGFRTVNEGKDDSGVCALRKLAKVAVSRPESVIGDVEAILIRAMAVQNLAEMNFAYEERWEQVKLDEVERFRKRVNS